MADLYRAACLEGLFLHLVENHVDCIQHEHVASQPSSHSTNKATSDNMPLPHPISYYHDPSHSLPYYPSPVGCYIREVFHKENQCYDCHKLGHQHSKCPTHTHAPAPKVNQLETELMAGNATSAYLTLAQTTPPADDDTHDMIEIGLGSEERDSTDVSVSSQRLGLWKIGAPVSHAVVNPASTAATLSYTKTRSTPVQTRTAAESDSLKDVLHKLQTEFHDVFCDDLGDIRNFPTISKTRSGIHFEINLKHGATPKHSAPYCVPEALLPRFREMLLEHLNAGRLRYSSSPWASLVFLVSKGNGKFRMVCDFRALNNIMVPDMYPMGNVQDILHRAARKGKIFAKLDCKDAFFQTLMKEEDIPKTAITTPLGLLEWVVMPQGIRNAPAAQQHRINEALQGLAGECCEAYVDDIIIWGKDAKDLHGNIVSVLSALRRSGLRCSREKSQLFLDEVSFLGHIIRPGQILPDPAKIARVEQFPLPMNSHQLHSFLGLVNYLRDFVPNLADHTVDTGCLTECCCIYLL
ncbi:hypothetical protein LQV05_001733 [Cryptococcus neoformans]|nr:hypothetical protein LQV05_001733 [Cryptococcus neoformans]